MDDEWDGRFHHDDDFTFCHHAPPLDPRTIPDPYSEDGYCCWCGNGSWKVHFPGCCWADTREGIDTAIGPSDPFPTDCPGCRESHNVHSGHGLIIESADSKLRLAD